MAREGAIVTPGTEEMTRVVITGAGAGITGAVEGVITKMAPRTGALAPLLTWGTLLTVPLVGIAGALFTRGMLGDLCQGIASGGLAVIGYTLPEMLAPITGRKSPGAGLTAEQRAAIAAGSVKQLAAGAEGAAQRAQQLGVKVGIDF